MYKIGVIGDKDSILGFKAAGFDTFITDSDKEAEEILKRAANDGYAVIYIIESLVSKLGTVLDDLKCRPIPAIIPIPGKDGSLSIGMSNIKKSVERAVGADILFKD